MATQSSPRASSSSPAAQALWRWQGVAGDLRRRPVLVWLLGISCVLVVVAVVALFVLPELTAQHHWQLAAQDNAKGNLAQAQQHLESCLQVWPRSGETHFEMARTCRRRGDFDRARAHLEYARQLSWPAGAIDLEYLLMQVQRFGPRGTDEATLHHFIYSNQHPDERLILEALTKGYLHTFYLSSANHWLNYWIEVHPEDWQPYLWRGELQERLKKDEDASNDFRRVLELNPEHGEAMLRLATLLQRRGLDYEQAMRLFRAYLAKHPNDPAALLGLAKCQRGLHDPNGARQTLGEVLAQEPVAFQAYHFAAILEADAEDYQRALEYLRKAEAIKPNELDTVYQLATVLRRLGRDADADKYLARHRELQQDFKDLIEATRAVVKNPQALDKRYEAGRILLKAGEEEGIRWLQTVLQEDPRHRQTHLALAEYYEKASDPRSAQLAQEHRRRAGLPPTP